MRLKQRIELRVQNVIIQLMAAVERMRFGVTFNPLDTATLANPYPVHNQMRETHAFYHSSMWNGYWVSSFEWAQEILKDKRFGAEVLKYPNRVKRITRNMSPRRLEIFNNPSMLDLDPPKHTRIRKLAQQGFVHRFIQSLEPRVREVVNECLDKTGNARTIDFVASLAQPLPVIIIAEMLGLPKEHHDRFCQWSEGLVAGTGTVDPDRIQASIDANRALIEYFGEMVAYKREHPGDDLLTRLIDAEEEGDRLTDLELYNTCVLLLAAGHETTTRLIGNGLYLLLQHPEQLQLLRDDPAMIPNAVEEMLRFEPPVHATRRFATEDMTLHGHTLKKGDLIFISIPGANRDPAINPDPDRFDITREDCHVLSFGYGVHLCIGASLARLEAKVAFEEILKRFDQLSLDQVPEWGRNPFFRGVDALKVAVQPARAPAETTPD